MSAQNLSASAVPEVVQEGVVEGADGVGGRARRPCIAVARDAPIRTLQIVCLDGPAGGRAQPPGLHRASPLFGGLQQH